MRKSERQPARRNRRPLVAAWFRVSGRASFAARGLCEQAVRPGPDARSAIVVRRDRINRWVIGRRPRSRLGFESALGGLGEFAIPGFHYRNSDRASVRRASRRSRTVIDTTSYAEPHSQKAYDRDCRSLDTVRFRHGSFKIAAAENVVASAREFGYGAFVSNRAPRPRILNVSGLGALLLDVSLLSVNRLRLQSAP